jgi:two-component system chemotaxis response regulator CheY
MRILLADDDHACRVLAEKTIRGLGHECETVSDGTRAWEAFRLRPPDVVISDLSMPGLTGLALCREIRNYELAGYTYFILCSGHDGHDRILEGMNAGADDYLLKPLNSNDLEAHLISAERVTGLHSLLGDQRTELERLNGELTAIGLRDPLTGLGNRRALEEDLARLEARVQRYGHRYCLALLDVDHFKAYNDTYGHQAGDRVLQIVAARLRDQARTGDALYRYGGEEFLCIFPEQSPGRATIAAERMRSSLEQQAVPHTGHGIGVLTLSAGVAMLDPDDTRTADEVLKEADEALYRAKRLGRNRVVYADRGRAQQPLTPQPVR